MKRIPSAAAMACLWLWAALGASAGTYNVRDFGAKADRTTNDAPAIQAALDACNRNGGGDVVIPSGNYLTGHLNLRSNVALVLQTGANLWASSRWEDYEKDAGGKPDTYLISGTDLENVSLAGGGQIHGLGEKELDRRIDGGSEDSVRTLPHRYGIMDLSKCRNVHIRDITIRFSERFTIYLDRCENVFIDGVSIFNNYWRTNTDGIDPSSCKNVFISNCNIVAGDDCICPKTSGGVPLENLVVTNCILESVATAIKLGTGSDGDYRDIRVSNCVIRNSGIPIGFFIKDGGTAERISFDNLSIETTRQDTQVNSHLRNSIIPIFIDIEQRNPPQSRIGTVRDVSFTNIAVTSDNSIVIQGMTQSLIQNLTLRNITFRVSEAFDFSKRTKQFGGHGNIHDDRITKYVRQPTYIALANIDGLVVDDVRVLVPDDIFQRFDRSAVAVFSSRDVTITNVERQSGPVAGGQPAVSLTDCQDVRAAPAAP